MFKKIQNINRGILSCIPEKENRVFPLVDPGFLETSAVPDCMYSGGFFQINAHGEI